jgi:osmotically-inducible protein OsmY
MHKRGGWKRGGWLALAALGLLAAGCNRDVTERLGRVGRLAVAKLDAATGGARSRLAGGWQAMRGSLGDPSTESRVVLRLQWDTMLAGTRLRVTSPAPGVVRLEGAVATFDQQRRAVGLAHTTEGVHEVEDALTLADH